MQYRIPLTDGIYTTGSNVTEAIGTKVKGINHQLNFAVKASSAPTAGTVTIQVRAPGSDSYEAVPDGEVGLIAPAGLLFQYLVEDYRFVVAGSDGVGQLWITDSSFEV